MIVSERMISCNNQRALRRVGRHRFLLSLLSVPMGLVVARLVARAVTFATGGDVRNTGRIALALTVAVIVWRGVEAAAQMALTREKSGILQDCRMDLYRALLRLPLRSLYQNERGQSIEGLTDDFYEVVKADTELMPGLCISVITLVCYGGYIAYYSPVTAGILALFSLLQMVPPILVKKYMQVNYDDCREIEAKLDGFLLEAYRGFSMIKLYGLKDWMLEKLRVMHKEYSRIGNRSTITCHAEDSLETLLTNILRYGTYGLVGWLVLTGWTTMEAGVGAIALSASFFAAVLAVFQTIPEFGTVKVARERLAKWLQDDDQAPQKNSESCGSGTKECPRGSVLCGDESKRNAGELLPKESAWESKDTRKNDWRFNENPKAPDKRTDVLRFDSVSYHYNNEETALLQEFSAAIGEGVTLIRGANGSGKSTLLKLAVGLLAPRSGKVLLAGMTPEQLPPQGFPENICYLPQEDMKIPLSAMELYRMVKTVRATSGAPGEVACATSGEPMEAACAANGAFVETECATGTEPAEGLDAVKAARIAASFGLTDELLREKKIDELSSGQRKKVYLSMTFALQPEVLLLDEPGNGLDADGERRLRELLKERRVQMQNPMPGISQKGGKVQKTEKKESFAGVTAVVTHDPSLDEVADHIIFVGERNE